MSQTPTTDLVSAQDSALDTLVELTQLDPTIDWSEAQAQVQNVRLGAAAILLQQQPVPDLSFLFGGNDEEPEDGAEAEVVSLDTVHAEPTGESLDPHGAPPIGGVG